MKITTILSITGLIIFPIIALAQTSDIQVAPTKSTDITTTTRQESAQISPTKEKETPVKCGISILENGRECGVGLYTRSYIQCYDGSQPIIGDDSSCKSAEEWSQFTKDVCINRCSAPQSSDEPPTTPAIPETAVPAKEQTPTTISGASAPTTVATSPDTKCGVYSSVVSNECGVGVYKNISAQCYDSFEVILGGTSSCKPTDLWNQYVKETCASRCSGRNGSEVVSTPSLPQPTESTPIYYYKETTEGGNRVKPLKPSSVPIVERELVSVCTNIDTLTQNYSDLVLELQKQEALNNKGKIEDITRNIENLKKYTEDAKKACATDPQTAWKVAAPPKGTESKPITAIENKPVAVSIDRCNEVAQWENKIVYYKKLGNLNEDELKKNGFSREEIEKIIQELLLGIEKVRTQCTSQEKTPIITKTTAITGSASIAETVKPVVAESGQEIDVYYKSRIEKAVSVKGEEKQIEALKTLRDEIDGLISNLIKSRKELEVSELNNLVKEVKVSRGEIKADDISVKTTEKKMLVSVGDRPVSVEPTENQVIIRDKGLEVNTNEVTIKENVLSIGGVDVKMSASEVAEKLGLTPTTIELKEENAKAVYNMQIDESRKLFGFISINVQRAVSVDAENGNTLSEEYPWYNFLTTK